jgi:hypothetical protein
VWNSRKAKISQTQNYIRERHVEMVCVVDLKTGEFHVTGRSYPTIENAKGYDESQYWDDAKTILGNCNERKTQNWDGAENLRRLRFWIASQYASFNVDEVAKPAKE